MLLPFIISSYNSIKRYVISKITLFPLVFVNSNLIVLPLGNSYKASKGIDSDPVALAGFTPVAGINLSAVNVPA